MDVPDIKCYEDEAINTVVSVINKAHEKMGVRLSLTELSNARETFTKLPHTKLSLASLVPPLMVTGEKFLDDAIKRTWRLTNTFKHVIKYLGASQDECSKYYYFEAIFSQPTVAYPIPQVTASVYFRIEDKQLKPPGVKKMSTIHFRVEGSHTDYDARYVLITPDWLLALMHMKLKYYKRVEELNMF